MRIEVRGGCSFIAALVWLWISFTGCSGDMPIQGFDLADPQDRGVVDSTGIENIDFAASFSDTVTPSGVLSPSLLLGAFNNVETRILVRFGNFPDSVTITKAAIVFITNRVIGSKDAKTTFPATVHRVTADWKEGTVTDENFQNAFDGSALATAEILSIVADTVRFNLNSEGVQLVNDWADTTDEVENFGVLIDFSASTFVKDFFARGIAAGQPVLEIVVEKPDAPIDTMTVAVDADAFLTRRLFEPPPGPLYVDHLFTSQSVIKFDFSNIPRESTVNRVTMTLRVDQERSLFAGRTFTVQIQRLKKSFSSLSPDSLELDNDLNLIVLADISATQTLITIPSELFRPVFRRMIQDWISERVPNHGFIFRSALPGSDISRVAIVSAEMDSTRAPKLSIDFSVAPTIVK